MHCGGLSRCKLALVFAVLMDLVGVASLLVGVFATVEIQGQDFGDFLLYSGALLLVMAMGGWVFWYSGNLEGLAEGEGECEWPIHTPGQIGGAVDRLARRLSHRIKSHRERGRDRERVTVQRSQTVK
ncbi:transmembrane protein 238a [Amia ocellicauda]|uniref:transmembrane protein 238a n=1 Tax=Amia ocellicauda TaxID=2972642 RepID=UPI0034638C2A